MIVEVEITPNPETLKFLPGKKVSEIGPIEFLKGEEKALKHHPLYARIDIIKTKHGFKVSEVEMVEPELFFLYREKGTFSPHQEALEKFYQGIKKRIDNL